MKKIISILMLVLMFFNLLGYYFAYRIMIMNAKEEMIYRIKDNREPENISLIKLPFFNGKVSDINFRFTDENEFAYKENMYDIVRSEIHDGFICFYCINDTNEELVNLQLNKHITDNFSDNLGTQKKSNKMVNELIKEYLPHINLSVPVPVFYGYLLFSTQEKVFTVKLDIASPPPRFNSLVYSDFV